MTVPLDRLYHYLGDVVNHDLLIYRWLPHGSRKLEDLDLLINYPEAKWYHSPIAIFHDQEPLAYDFYSPEQIRACAKALFLRDTAQSMLADPILDYLSQQHLRGIACCANYHDLTILVHSEQHGVEVDRFEQAGFVPVYYWSHAVIAQNWFRYAEHDPKLAFDPTTIQQDFLIYNRAWAGTREYRLCFAEQLLEHNLVQHCNINFNPEDGKHYSTHQFVNPDFQIVNYNLHDELRPNTHDSTASADYCGEDYSAAGIEIVLETLFDDSRWHLTEKTLRPIACGRPFILMATAGSLQYLQRYGFETFGELIDESYDQIVNPKHRLQAVIAEMARIAALSTETKTQLFVAMNVIALRNHQRFFNGFHDQVINEYKTNMDYAMSTMQQHCTGQHLAHIKELLNNQ